MIGEVALEDADLGCCEACSKPINTEEDLKVNAEISGQLTSEKNLQKAY